MMCRDCEQIGGQIPALPPARIPLLVSERSPSPLDGSCVSQLDFLVMDVTPPDSTSGSHLFPARGLEDFHVASSDYEVIEYTQTDSTCVGVIPC